MFISAEKSYVGVIKRSAQRKSPAQSSLAIAKFPLPTSGTGQYPAKLASTTSPVYIPAYPVTVPAVFPPAAVVVPVAWVSTVHPAGSAGATTLSKSSSRRTAFSWFMFKLGEIPTGVPNFSDVVLSAERVGKFRLEVWASADVAIANIPKAEYTFFIIFILVVLFYN